MTDAKEIESLASELQRAAYLHGFETALNYAERFKSEEISRKAMDDLLKWAEKALLL